MAYQVARTGQLVQPLTFVLFTCVVVIPSIMKTTSAQYDLSACDSDDTITISFPEYPEGIAPPSGDARFEKTILDSTTEPYEVTIQDDPNIQDNPKEFDNYFSAGFNAFSTPPSYVVQYTKGVDRDGVLSGVEDDINILQFLLVCQATPTSQEIWRVLKIQILDENDNAPYFINAPYAFSVNELTPIGLTVNRLISTTDLDEGNNKMVTFSLSNNVGAQYDGASVFGLPVEQEGLISVSGFLDFERMYQDVHEDASLVYYNLTIYATDGGAPALSTTTSLIINIEDGDDLGPEFVYSDCLLSSDSTGKTCVRPEYRASIHQGFSSFISLTSVPGGANVTMVMQDRDTLNSPVSCNISATVPAGYESSFSASSSQLNPNSKQYVCHLEYTNAQSIDRSTVPTLDVVVVAQEQSSQAYTEYATVKVTFLQENNFNPTISPSSSDGYIYETSLVGTFVSETTEATTPLKLNFYDEDLLCTDPDQAYDIRITPEDTPFNVTSDGFIQLTSASLEYEMQTLYDLDVTIIEQTAERRQSQPINLKIHVLDLNDEAPQFNYIVSVQEGVYNTPVIIISAVALDADSPPFTYNLVSLIKQPEAASGALNMSSAGTLRLSGEVHAGDRYYAYMMATDYGNPRRSSLTVVVVSVLEKGSKELYCTANSASISEEDVNGQILVLFLFSVVYFGSFFKI